MSTLPELMTVRPRQPEAVNYALEKFNDSDEGTSRDDKQEEVTQDKMQRNHFLDVCQESGEAYQAARQLIQNEKYWQIEEKRFRTMNQILIEYNWNPTRYGHIEWKCPTSVELAGLYHRRVAQTTSLTTGPATGAGSTGSIDAKPKPTSKHVCLIDDCQQEISQLQEFENHQEYAHDHVLV